MEHDFVEKYARGKPEFRASIKDVYGEVVNDLIDGLRYEHMPLLDRDEKHLHTIATYAIRYAYELTRDIGHEIFEARRSKALHRLEGEIHNWQEYRERSEAEQAAARLAAAGAKKRAALEAKRLKRRSKIPND